MESTTIEKQSIKTAYVSELLNGDNYLTWEQEIQFTLEDENCKEPPLCLMMWRKVWFWLEYRVYIVWLDLHQE